MKEEALKLADELRQYTINDGVDDLNKRTIAMIRRLVEELDKAYSDGEVCGGCGAIRYDPICEKQQTKRLSDDEIIQIYSQIDGRGIINLVRAVEERYGIK